MFGVLVPISCEGRKYKPGHVTSPSQDTHTPLHSGSLESLLMLFNYGWKSEGEKGHAEIGENMKTPHRKKPSAQISRPLSNNPNHIIIIKTTFSDFSSPHVSLHSQTNAETKADSTAHGSSHNSWLVTKHNSFHLSSSFHIPNAWPQRAMSSGLCHSVAVECLHNDRP